MRLVVLTLELGFVWLIYYLFGLAMAFDLPIWLTAFLVLIVDRLVGRISDTAKSKRKRLP